MNHYMTVNSFTQNQMAKQVLTFASFSALIYEEAKKYFLAQWCCKTIDIYQTISWYHDLNLFLLNKTDTSLCAVSGLSILTQITKQENSKIIFQGHESKS